MREITMLWPANKSDHTVCVCMCVYVCVEISQDDLARACHANITTHTYKTDIHTLLNCSIGLSSDLYITLTTQSRLCACLKDICTNDRESILIVYHGQSELQLSEPIHSFLHSFICAFGFAPS